MFFRENFSIGFPKLQSQIIPSWELTAEREAVSAEYTTEAAIWWIIGEQIRHFGRKLFAIESKRLREIAVEGILTVGS